MQHFGQDVYGQGQYQAHQGQPGNGGMDWQPVPAQGARGADAQEGARQEGGGPAHANRGGMAQAGRFRPYPAPHLPPAEDMAIWRQNVLIMQEQREAQRMARMHQEQMARMGNVQMNERAEQVFQRQGAQRQEAGAGHATPLLRQALMGGAGAPLPSQAGAGFRPQQPQPPQQQQQQQQHHHLQQVRQQQQVLQPHFAPRAGFVFGQLHPQQQHQQPDIRQHQPTPIPPYFNHPQQPQPLPQAHHQQEMARNYPNHAPTQPAPFRNPMPQGHQQQHPQPPTPLHPTLPIHTPSPQNAIDDDLLERLKLMNTAMKYQTDQINQYEADKQIANEVMKLKDEQITELLSEVENLKMALARIVPPATNTVGTEMSPPPALPSTSTQTTPPPPSTSNPSTSSVSPPPPPRSPIHIKQEVPEVEIEEGEIIFDRMVARPDQDTTGVEVVGCAVVLPEERRRFASHPEAVQFWETNFGGWQNPGVERNLPLNLNEYLFNSNGGEATPQMVKKPVNSTNFYQNQRPARRGYPAWTSMSASSKKRWLEMWMEVRKQQDLQVRSGLIVFRADVEAGRVKTERVTN